MNDAYGRLAEERGARLAAEIVGELPPALVAPGVGERMVSRLLGGAIGLARSGETIHASLGMRARGDGTMLCLAVDRPEAIAGVAEADLLDPGYSPDGDWPAAPALGLGFALRLIRNLAEAVGGALVVDESAFALYLPVPQQPGEREGAL